MVKQKKNPRDQELGGTWKGLGLLLWILLEGSALGTGEGENGPKGLLAGNSACRKDSEGHAHLGTQQLNASNPAAEYHRGWLQEIQVNHQGSK